MNNAMYGNVPHGIWSDAKKLSIFNLSIRDVYQHDIILNSGAEDPHICNVHLIDNGERFFKANLTAYGNGLDNGIVEYSVMEYTDSTPSHPEIEGYTNGVDVHSGQNLVIRNILFKNLHTPNSAKYHWKPAILMWRGDCPGRHMKN